MLDKIFKVMHNTFLIMAKFKKIIMYGILYKKTNV